MSRKNFYVVLTLIDREKQLTQIWANEKLCDSAVWRLCASHDHGPASISPLRGRRRPIQREFRLLTLINWCVVWNPKTPIKYLVQQTHCFSQLESAILGCREMLNVHGGSILLRFSARKEVKKIRNCQIGKLGRWSRWMLTSARVV